MMAAPSPLSDLQLGVAPGSGELILFRPMADGSRLQEKRLITWETMRAVVAYMHANGLDTVEVWVAGEKYDLRLGARKSAEASDQQMSAPVLAALQALREALRAEELSKEAGENGQLKP